MTREFMEQVKGILADDGVVVANVFLNSRLYDAELKTYQAVFGRCQAYLGGGSGNVIIAALGPDAEPITKAQAAKRAKALQTKHKFSFSITAVARLLKTEPRPATKAIVLTDDRAPVNVLRTQPRDTTKPKETPDK